MNQFIFEMVQCCEAFDAFELATKKKLDLYNTTFYIRHAEKF